jgi:hypothetical protein
MPPLPARRSAASSAASPAVARSSAPTRRTIDNETLAGVGRPGGRKLRSVLPAPPAFVDSMGRAAMGSDGDADVARHTGRGCAPISRWTSRRLLPRCSDQNAVSDRSVRSPARRSSLVAAARRGRFTNEATGVEHPPVVPDDTSRAYRNFTDQELASAANALANKREARRQAERRSKIRSRRHRWKNWHFVVTITLTKAAM